MLALPTETVTVSTGGRSNSIRYPEKSTTNGTGTTWAHEAPISPPVKEAASSDKTEPEETEDDETGSEGASASISVTTESGEIRTFGNSGGKSEAFP